MLKLLFVLIINTVLLPVLGAYGGQVVDSMTGEPVIGASVLISWKKATHSLEILHRAVNTTAGAVVLFTDDEGNYSPPADLLSIPPPGVLRQTTLAIYQPGYQFHKKRQYCGGGKASYGETESNILKKRIQLDRVPPIFDHDAHFWSIKDTITALAPEYRDIGKRLLLRRAEWEQHQRDK